MVEVLKVLWKEYIFTKERGGIFLIEIIIILMDIIIIINIISKIEKVFLVEKVVLNIFFFVEGLCDGLVDLSCCGFFVWVKKLLGDVYCIFFLVIL